MLFTSRDAMKCNTAFYQNLCSLFGYSKKLIRKLDIKQANQVQVSLTESVTVVNMQRQLLLAS